MKREPLTYRLTRDAALVVAVIVLAYTVAVVPVFLIPVQQYGLLFMLGLFAIIYGRRGRRVGTIPHCPKCSYNLTGLTSNICPECGTTFTPGEAVQGIRKRRSWAIIVGAVLALAGGVRLGQLGYARISRIDTYKYQLVGALVRKAGFGELRAVHELIRRADSGLLSCDDMAPLIEPAMATHSGVPRWMQGQTWAQLITWFDSLECLSQAQRDMFYQRYEPPMSLVVRSIIRQGDPIQVLSTTVGYFEAPPRRRLIHRNDRFLFDGAQVGGSQIESDRWWYRSITLPTLDVQPGIHQVEYVTTIAIFGEGAALGHATPVWLKEVRLAADVEVLPPDAPDPIVMNRDESLAEDMRNAIAEVEVDYGPATENEKGWLCVLFQSRVSPPKCVSADIVVLYRNNEIKVGSVCFETSQWWDAMDCIAWDWPGADDPFDVAPEKVTVELRPNPDPARETLDCFEIWGETLRFEDVEVVHEP